MPTNQTQTTPTVVGGNEFGGITIHQNIQNVGTDTSATTAATMGALKYGVPISIANKLNSMGAL